MTAIYERKAGAESPLYLAGFFGKGPKALRHPKEAKALDFFRRRGALAGRCVGEEGGFLTSLRSVGENGPAWLGVGFEVGNTKQAWKGGDGGGSGMGNWGFSSFCIHAAR